MKAVRSLLILAALAMGFRVLAKLDALVFLDVSPKMGSLAWQPCR